MNYQILQLVKIVDMNDEPMKEIYFDHGEFDLPPLPNQCSVITHKLGLKGFEIVFDKRDVESSNQRYKIIDTEINLVHTENRIVAYLEPITLILGQHDVGEV